MATAQDLQTYRTEPPKVGHLTFWDTLVAPGVMQQRDGSFLAVIRFRGPDLHSAPTAALIAQAHRLNSLWRRFGGGWGLMTDARRRQVSTYPTAEWPDPVSAFVDQRRRHRFAQPGTHFQTTNFLTLVYRPRRAVIPGWKHLLYTNLPDDDAETLYLEQFAEEVERTTSLLADCCPKAEGDEEPPVEWLTESALLTYLHSTVSMKEYPVRVPVPPRHLDTYLTDGDLERAWRPPSLLRWPCLGGQWLRCVAVKAYPDVSHPGMLDTLESLPLEYRATTRYLPLERAKAITELRKYRRAHDGQKQTAVQSFVHKHGTAESVLFEQAALDKAEEANQAQAEVTHGQVSYGYLTQTVVVWDQDFDAATQKAQTVEQALNSAGFTAKVEGLNTMDAWKGSLPGNMVDNVRRPLVNSQNLAHLVPATTPTTGRPWNPHLQAPALLLATGRGHVPFWLNHHVGDVGHVRVIGPVGMGKSTLLALMALQWRRYQGGQVFALDKGSSLRCATYAVGGHWYNMGAELERHFQAGASVEDIGFQSLGLGWEPRPGPWQVFEMEELLKTPAMAAKTFYSIYEWILPRLTGVPTLLILDEGHLYLRHVPHLVQDMLKDLRKKETSVVFCAQSIADASTSPIAHDLNEQCLTRIFLSNYRALEPETGKLYADYGLNDRQREIIAHLVPKRQYYHQGYAEQGNQVFDLELDAATLAFVGRSRPRDLAAMEEVYREDPHGFAVNWLHHQGLHREADELKSLGGLYEDDDRGATAPHGALPTTP